jgi:prenyltransferase beta subunit
MVKHLYVVALGIAVCLAPARGQPPEEKKATIAYLHSLQAPDGGFLAAQPKPGTEPANQSSLRATSSALRALKYFGGEPRDKAACDDFVQRCFDKDSGGFADRPGGKPDVTSTAVGIMAVVELKLPTDYYTEGVVKYLSTHAKTFDEIRIAAAGLESIGQKAPQKEAWLAQLAKLRNPDGTYGQGDGAARDTGSAVVVELRLMGKLEHPEQVIRTLRMGQRPDGGFGKDSSATSDLETSYRIMRAFVMLKEKLSSPGRCRAFVAKCRNADGGYGLAPGQPSSASGTYFASILLHWLADQ